MYIKPGKTVFVVKEGSQDSLWLEEGTVKNVVIDADGTHYVVYINGGFVPGRLDDLVYLDRKDAEDKFRELADKKTEEYRKVLLDGLVSE